MHGLLIRQRPAAKVSKGVHFGASSQYMTRRKDAFMHVSEMVVGSVAAQWQSGPNWQKSQVRYWHAHGVVASAWLAHAAKCQSSSNVISFNQAVH